MGLIREQKQVMDRNTLIGIVLIIGILFTFQILNQPSEEELQQRREQQEQAILADSIAQLEKQEKLATQSNEVAIDSTLTQEQRDSIFSARQSELNNKLTQSFSVFAPSAQGEKEYFVIENDDLKITISSKGGEIVKTELKKYQSYKNYMRAKDSLKDTPSKKLPILEPLQLFDEDSRTKYI